MTKELIDNAFILAAGFGKRLRPYTDHVPKPLVEVAGRTLLERTLDHLEAANVKNVTINLYHLGEKIEELLKDRTSPAITFSRETEILETGGGIKKALSNFEGRDFFICNGDALWIDSKAKPALERLREAWNPEEMDILLLLQPVDSMKLTHGVGDYNLSPEGRAVWATERNGKYMFTGIRISSSGIFENTPDGYFSYLELMHKAEKAGRLYGLVHDGDWHHISTPDDLERVNKALEFPEEEA